MLVVVSGGIFVCGGGDGDGDGDGDSDGGRLVGPNAQAAWSSGMILASGARDPGFNSWSSPFRTWLWLH